jgi:hypothetical protein
VRTRPAPWILLAAAIAAISITPRDAAAGRRHFAWSEGVETLPERGYEIESWVSDELGVGDVNLDQTRLGWAIAFGVTDRIELRLPAEVVWSRAAAEPAARTSIDRYGAELRYRLVSSDPVDAPAFAPLIRIAAFHQANEREAARFELDLVGEYRAGRVLALADVGVAATVRRGEDGYQLRPGGGVSIDVGHDLRIGVEVRAQLALRGDDALDWITVGPTLGWTHGRGWLVLNAGIGVSGVLAAPRLGWGVSF